MSDMRIKKEPKYARKGHVIMNLETGTSQTFKGNNEAKRESHKIQMMAEQGLGRGILREVPSKPKTPKLQLSGLGRNARG